MTAGLGVGRARAGRWLRLVLPGSAAAYGERRLIQLALAEPGCLGDRGGGVLEPLPRGGAREHLVDRGRQVGVARARPLDDEHDLTPSTVGELLGELAQRPARDLLVALGELAADGAAALGARTPSKAKRSVGRPLSTSAVSTALGPGSAVTRTSAAMAASTRM